MNLFLYEFITGGGLLRSDGVEPMPPSLLREGRAMVEAVARDLAAIQGQRTMLVRDRRVRLRVPGCSVESVSSSEAAAAAFDRLAAECDATLLIAPEFDGLLAQCCLRVVRHGGRLVGPSAELVELAGDKHATARHLSAAGLSVPEGIALVAGAALPRDFPFPAVIKPRDGAGSQNIRLLHTAAEAAAYGPLRFAARLERFCPGVAASVAVLCGPDQLRSLVPCRQHLSDDGRFRYLGGSLPLRSDLADRASRLAEAAIGSLASPRGYLGVDLVLGPSERDDVIVEINPRLTTSYVGLRAASRVNLADAMLRIAAGESPELSFRDEPLQFDAGGTVRHLQGSAS